LRVLFVFLLLGLILSIGIALTFPSIGVHSSGGLEPQHEGLWKGIFGHKNQLGQAAVLTMALAFTLPSGRPATRALVWLAGAAALLTMLQVDSGGASATAVIVACGYSYIRALSKLPRVGRAAAAVIGVLLLLPPLCCLKASCPRF
jgi:hypothetical protein